MKETAAFPLSYTMSPVKELCTEKADCYLVKLQLNRKGQAIYGYLSIRKEQLQRVVRWYSVLPEQA